MILSAGSNAPVLTLPACRQTSVLSSSGGSASARILPWPSTGTRITRSPPRPTSISALSTLTWTSSPTTTVMGGAPNSPFASTLQPRPADHEPEEATARRCHRRGGSDVVEQRNHRRRVGRMLRERLIQPSQIGEGLRRGGHAAVFQVSEIAGCSLGGRSQQILHPVT